MGHRRQPVDGGAGGEVNEHGVSDVREESEDLEQHGDEGGRRNARRHLLRSAPAETERMAKEINERKVSDVEEVEEGLVRRDHRRRSDGGLEKLAAICCRPSLLSARQVSMSNEGSQLRTADIEKSARPESRTWRKSWQVL
ncbi:hypothetical protein LTR56_010034 [Elasticomyces elasticus]|nr:hypothetical protein LTR56_010034 [Elasticomyces elasticus]KAK3665028.1 hypothetical protein LTR22_004082 [Elasticomyces elasticus]KAK4931596.1 hypothetical protein LTR49_001986 [Elasticomyces elasticus]KAK5766755.1 hypothetical protein LTS12_003106 [Elasticomyces elasticus]